MTYRLDLATDPRFIDIRYVDAVSASELHAAAREALRSMKGPGVTRALADLREVTRIDASSFSVFEMPAHIYDDEGASPSLRIAVVVPDDAAIRDLARFYESACINRGWQARLFDSRDAAQEWLTGAS